MSAIVSTALPPAADDETLHRSWFDFLKTESNEFTSDCKHIHNFDNDECKLSMLQRITTQRILDYREKETPTSLSTLQSKLDTFLQANGPTLNLKTQIQSQSPSMALAAEFKRASPSKGDICVGLSAGTQAHTYFKAGASVISVLTEERWFKGSLVDLTEARTCTQSSCSDIRRPAILRKDFIFSEYQILEAAASGADTVLLIVAVLPAPLLRRLIEYCRTIDMEPLVEVHAPSELDVALNAGAKVIGVNNRNLHTFQMDLTTTDRTSKELTRRGLCLDPSDADSECVLCSLSGMSTASDVHRYRELNVGMVLIGESLMRAANVESAIKALCLDPAVFHEMHQSSTGGAYIKGTQLAKICGVTNPEDALVACQAGANLIGVIFAQRSKRRVTSDQAKAVVETVRRFGERDARVDIRIDSANINSNSPIVTLVYKAQLLQQVATSRRPLVVGVFQNQSSDFIEQMVNESGIDLVQLHGAEGMEAANPNKCGGVPALRVVDIPHVDGGMDHRDEAVSKILSSLTSDPLAILLDTTVVFQTNGEGGGGGTGKTFDWKIAQQIQNNGLPVIIAGGLTPDNVGEAVLKTRPYGVDVSSGTEQCPGKKDENKVKNFLNAVRTTSEEASKGF